MPNLPHLVLPRAEFDLPRKKSGFGRIPQRHHGTHGRALSEELEGVLSEFRARSRPKGIDPSLILRIQLNAQAGVDEDAWERSGLVLLSIDENKTLVLFSSDVELSEFKRRLSEYQLGPPPEQKGAPHQQMFASIDEIGEVRPEDRIGRLLRAEGVTSLEEVEELKQYVADVELWDLGSRDANRNNVAELRRFIEQGGGRVSDDYVGESLVLLRAHCIGRVIKDLLTVDYVAKVDLPPTPTLTVSQLLDLGLEDFPETPVPEAGAPGVAVLDSGLSAATPPYRTGGRRGHQRTAGVGRRVGWSRSWNHGCRPGSIRQRRGVHRIEVVRAPAHSVQRACAQQRLPVR